MDGEPFWRLIGGGVLGEFLEGVWNCRAVVFRGAADRFDFLGFGWSTLTSSWASERGDGPEARRPPALKAQHRDVAGRHRELRCTPAEAEPLFQEGLTLCVPDAHRCSPALMELARSARRCLGLSRPAVINCYRSPPGGGFGLHFDNHSVFILQIEGSKRWRFSARPGLVNPVRNYLSAPDQAQEYRERFAWADVTPPDPATLEDTTLEPGDFLYLPPGSWHEGTAGHHSLGLSLTCPCVRVSEMVSALLLEGLDTSPEWRAGVWGAAPEQSPAQQEQALRQALARRLEELRDRVSRLEVDELMARCRRLVAGGGH